MDEPRLFQLFLKEIGYLAQQVVACIAAIDAMVAVGVIQLFEVFVGLNKRFCILKGVLRMHIVVCQAVANEQGSMQIVGARHGVVVVSLGILFGRTHVSLGVDGVVVAE